MDGDKKKSLTKLAMGGAMAGVGAKLANFIIGIGSVAILARLLTPLEYGLFGLVTICLTLSQLVPQAISTAMIRQSQERARDVGAGVTLVLITGLFIACLLMVMRNGIATFFNADVSNELIFAAVIVPLIALSAYFDGVMAKNFEFKRGALYDFLSTVLGQTLVSLVLAYLGFGVWALLFGTAAANLIKLCLQLSTGMWRHAKPRRVTRELVAMSFWIFVSNIWNYLARNADNMLVGKLLGSESLGFYQRAYNLMMRPVQLVSGATMGVFYPLVASINSDDARMRSAYLRGIVMASLIGLPMSAFLFAHGYEVISIVFGERWLAVVSPFMLLTLGLYFRFAYGFSIVSLTSVGDMRSVSQLQFLYAVLVIVASYFGSRWGIDGVAAGVAFALLVFFLVSAARVCARFNINAGEFALSHLAGVCISVLAAGPSLLLHDSLSQTIGSFGVLLVGGVFFVSSYAVALFGRRILFRDQRTLDTLDDIEGRLLSWLKRFR